MHSTPDPRGLPCAGGSFDLTPELQQEYQRLKVEADQETYNASLDLRKAAAALQDEQVKHQAALNQVHQMQSQRDKLLTEIEEVCVPQSWAAAFRATCCTW